MDALVGNAADKKQLRRARKIEGEASRREKDDFVKLMSLPEFRRYIWRMLEETRTFETIMAPNATIYYNSGRQDIGHIMLGDVMEYTPEQFITLIQEHNSHET